MKESSMSLARKILLALLAVLMAVGGLVGVLMLDRGVSASAEEGSSVEAAAEKDVTYDVLPSEAKETFAAHWSTPDDWTRSNDWGADVKCEHVTVTYINSGATFYSLNGATAVKMTATTEVQLPGLKNGGTYYLPVSDGSAIKILTSPNPVFYDTTASKGTVYLSLITKDSDFHFVGEDGKFAMLGYVDAKTHEYLYFGEKGIYTAKDLSDLGDKVTILSYQDNTVKKALAAVKGIIDSVTGTDSSTGKSKEESFTYDGSEKNPAAIAKLLQYSAYITLEGDLNKTNAGNYTYTVKLKDGYTWPSVTSGTDEEKTAPKEVTWSIAKGTISAQVAENYSFDVNSTESKVITITQKGDNANLFTGGWTCAVTTDTNKILKAVTASPDGLTFTVTLAEDAKKLGEATLTFTQNNGTTNLNPCTGKNVLTTTITTTCSQGLVVGNTVYVDWAKAIAAAKTAATTQEGDEAIPTINVYGEWDLTANDLKGTNQSPTTSLCLLGTKGAIINFGESGLDLGIILEIGGSSSDTTNKTENYVTVNGNVNVLPGAAFGLGYAKFNGSLSVDSIAMKDGKPEAPKATSAMFFNVVMNNGTVMVANQSATFSIVGENTINNGTIALTNGAKLTGTSATLNFVNPETKGVEGSALSAVNATVSGSIAFTFKNYTAANGGAIYLDEGATFAAASVTAENCSAEFNGGAVYVGFDSTFEVSNFKATNCSAKFNGGAVYLSEKAKKTEAAFTVNGNAIFTGNTAANGGAVYINGGKFEVTGAEYTGNTATNGGAIYVAKLNADATFTGTFKSNTATNGGAIYVSAFKNTLTLNGITVSGNSGAGIYLADDAKVTLTSYSGILDTILLAGTGSQVTLTDNSGELTFEFADVAAQASKLVEGASRYETTPIYIILSGNATALNAHVKEEGYKFEAATDGLYLIPSSEIVAVVISGEGEAQKTEKFTDLQSALNRAAALNVSTVYLVNGTNYTLDETITLNSNLTLKIANKDTFALATSGKATLKASKSLHGNMIVVAGGTLTLEAGVTLNGKVVVESEAALVVNGAEVGSIAMSGKVTVKGATASVGSVTYASGLLDVTAYTGTTQITVTPTTENGKITAATGNVVKEKSATDSKVNVTGISADSTFYTYTYTAKEQNVDVKYTALGLLEVNFTQTAVNEINVSGTSMNLKATKVTLTIGKDDATTLTVANNAFSGTLDLGDYVTSNNITVTIAVTSVEGKTTTAYYTRQSVSIDAVLLKDGTPEMTLFVPTGWTYYTIKDGKKSENPGTLSGNILDGIYIDADGNATFVEGTDENAVEHTIFVGKRVAKLEAGSVEAALIDAAYVTPATPEGAQEAPSAYTTLTFSVGVAFAGYEFRLKNSSNKFDDESVWTSPVNGVVTLKADATNAGKTYTLLARVKATDGNLPSNSVTVGGTYTTLTSTQGEAKDAFEEEYANVFNGNTLYENATADNFTKSGGLFDLETDLKTALNGYTTSIQNLNTKIENLEKGYAYLYVREWTKVHGPALQQAVNYVMGSKIFDYDPIDVATLLAKLEAAYTAYLARTETPGDKLLTNDAHNVLTNFKAQIEEYYSEFTYTATVAGVSKTLPLDDATTSYIKVAMHAILTSDAPAAYRDALLARFADVDSIEKAKPIYENCTGDALTTAKDIAAAYENTTKAVAVTAEYKSLMEKLANSSSGSLDSIKQGYTGRLAFAAEKDAVLQKLTDAYTAVGLKDVKQADIDDILKATNSADLLSVLKEKVTDLLALESGVYKNTDSENVKTYLDKVLTAINAATSIDDVLAAVEKTTYGDADELTVADALEAIRTADVQAVADMYKAAIAFITGGAETDVSAFADLTIVAANAKLGELLIARFDSLNEFYSDKANHAEFSAYFTALKPLIEKVVEAANSNSLNGNHPVADVIGAAMETVTGRLSAAKNNADTALKDYYKALKTSEEDPTEEFYTTTFKTALNGITFDGEGAETNILTALGNVNTALINAAKAVLDSCYNEKQDGKIVADKVAEFKSAFDKDDNAVDEYYRLCTALLTLQANGKLAGTDPAKDPAILSVRDALAAARTREIKDVKQAFLDAYVNAMFPANSTGITLKEDGSPDTTDETVKSVFDEVFKSETTTNYKTAYTALKEYFCGKEGVSGAIASLADQATDSAAVYKFVQGALAFLNTQFSNSDVYVTAIVWNTTGFTGVKANIDKTRADEYDKTKGSLKAVYDALFGADTEGFEKYLTALGESGTPCTTLNTSLQTQIEEILKAFDSGNKYTTAINEIKTAITARVTVANTANNIFVVDLSSVMDNIKALHDKSALDNAIAIAKAEIDNDCNGLESYAEKIGAEYKTTVSAAIAAAQTAIDACTTLESVETTKNAQINSIASAAMKAIALKEFDESYKAFKGTAASDFAAIVAAIKAMTAETDINTALATAIKGWITAIDAKEGTVLSYVKVTLNDVDFDKAETTVNTLNAKIKDFSALLENAYENIELAKEIDTHVGSFNSSYTTLTTAVKDRMYNGEAATLDKTMTEGLALLKEITYDAETYTDLENAKEDVQTKFAKLLLDLQVTAWKSVAKKEFVETVPVIYSSAYSDAALATFVGALDALEDKSTIAEWISQINTALSTGVADAIKNALAEDSVNVEGLVTAETTGLNAKLNNITSEAANTSVVDLSAKVAKADFNKFDDKTFKEAVTGKRHEDHETALATAKGYYNKLKGLSEYTSVEDVLATLKDGATCTNLNETLAGIVDAIFTTLYTQTYANDSTAARNEIDKAQAAYKEALATAKSGRTVLSSALPEAVNGFIAAINSVKTGETQTAKDALKAFAVALDDNAGATDVPATLKGKYDELLALYKDEVVANATTLNNALKKDVKDLFDVYVAAVVKADEKVDAEDVSAIVTTLKTAFDNAFAGLTKTEEGKTTFSLADSEFLKDLGNQAYATIQLELDRVKAQKALNAAYNTATGETKRMPSNGWTDLTALKTTADNTLKGIVIEKTEEKGWRDDLTNKKVAVAKLLADNFIGEGLTDIFERTRFRKIATEEYTASYTAIKPNSTPSEGVLQQFNDALTLDAENTALANAIKTLITELKAEYETQEVQKLIDDASTEINFLPNTATDVIEVAAKVKTLKDNVDTQRLAEKNAIKAAYDAVYKTLTGATAVDATASPVKEAYAAIDGATSTYAANLALAAEIAKLLVGTPAEGGATTPTDYSLLKAGDSNKVQTFLKGVVDAVKNLIEGESYNGGANVVAAGNDFASKEFTEVEGVNTLSAVRTQFEALRQAAVTKALAQYEAAFKAIYGNDATLAGQPAIDKTMTVTTINGLLEAAIKAQLDAASKDADQSLSIRKLFEDTADGLAENTAKTTDNETGVTVYDTVIEAFSEALAELQAAERDAALNEYVAAYNACVSANTGIGYKIAADGFITVENVADATESANIKAVLTAIKDLKSAKARNAKLEESIKAIIPKLADGGHAQEVKDYVSAADTLAKLGEATWTTDNTEEVGIKDYSAIVDKIKAHIESVLVAGEKADAIEKYEAAYKAFFTTVDMTDSIYTNCTTDINIAKTAEAINNALIDGIKAIIAAYKDDGDSAAVAAYIAKESSEDSSIIATGDRPANGIYDYESLYTEVKTGEGGIDEQRKAEVQLAKDQYIAIYKVLYSGAEPETDAVNALFKIDVSGAAKRDAKTAGEANEKLIAAVNALLGTNGTLVYVAATADAKDGTLDTAEIINKYLKGLGTAIVAVINTANDTEDSGAARRIPDFDKDKINAPKVTINAATAEAASSYAIGEPEEAGKLLNGQGSIEEDLKAMRAIDVEKAYESYKAAYIMLMTTVKYTEVKNTEGKVTGTKAEVEAPKDAEVAQADFTATAANAKEANDLVLKLLKEALLGVETTTGEGTSAKTTYDYSKSILDATDAKSVYEYLNGTEEKTGIYKELTTLVMSVNVGATRSIVSFDKNELTTYENLNKFVSRSKTPSNTAADNVENYAPLQAEALRAGSIKAVQTAYLTAYEQFTGKALTVGETDGKLSCESMDEATLKAVQDNYDALGQNKLVTDAITTLMGYIHALVDGLKTATDAKDVTTLVGGLKKGIDDVLTAIINGQPKDRELPDFESAVFNTATAEHPDQETISAVVSKIATNRQESITAAVTMYKDVYKALTNVDCPTDEARAVKIRQAKNAIEANELLLTAVKELLIEKLYYKDLDANEILTYLQGDAVWKILTDAPKSENGISKLNETYTLKTGATSSVAINPIPDIKKAVEKYREDEKAAAIAEYIAAFEVIKGFKIEVNDNGYVKASNAEGNREDDLSLAQAAISAIEKIDERTQLLHAVEMNNALLKSMRDLLDSYANKKVDSANVLAVLEGITSWITNPPDDLEIGENGIADLAKSGYILATKNKIAEVRTADITAAMDAFVKVYNAITGGEKIGEYLTKEGELADTPIKDALAVIKSAANAKEANAALAAQIAALIEGMKGNESATVASYLEDLSAALVKLVNACDNAKDRNNNVARSIVDFETAQFTLRGADTKLADVATALATMRNAERDAAADQYKAFYKTMKGKDCPDDDEGLAAIKNAASTQAINEALVAGVKALFESYITAEDPATAYELAQKAITAIQGEDVPKVNDVLVLSDIVDPAVEEIIAARAQFKEDAKNAYLEVYNALTGKTATATSDDVADAMKAIEAAKDAKAANDALLAQIKKLLAAGGGLLTAGDSKNVEEFFTTLFAAVEQAFEGKNDENSKRVVPTLTSVVEGKKAALEAIKAEEIAAAQDAYKVYYEAITGNALGGIFTEIQDMLDSLAKAENNTARNTLLKNKVTELINAAIKDDAQSVKDVAKPLVKALGDAFDKATKDGVVADGLADDIASTMEEIELQRYKQAALDKLNGVYNKIETSRMEAATKTKLDNVKSTTEKTINDINLTDSTLTQAKSTIDTRVEFATEQMLRAEAEGVAKQEYLATYEAVTGTALKALPANVQKAIEDAATKTDYVDAVNTELGKAILTLLDSYVKKEGNILKDSKEVKALVDAAKMAVENTFNGAANGKVPAVSKLEALQGLLADIEDKRAEEKGAVSGAMDKTFEDLTSGKTYPDDIKKKVDDLLADAKKKVEDGTISYADYELLQAQVEGQIKLYNTLAELTAQAKEDGLDISNVKKAVEDAIAELGKTTNTAEVQKAANKAVITINREYAKSTLVALTANDSAAVKSVLEGPNGFNARLEAAKNDTEIQSLVAEAKIAIKGERFVEKYAGLAKAFNDLAAGDKDSLVSGQEAFASNDADVKAYLEARAKTAGYSSYASEMADRLNKINFEAEKANSVSELEAEAQKQYGTFVRDVLNGELNKLDAIEYEAQMNDADRAGYLAAQMKALGDALNAAKTTIQRAQNVQKSIEELQAVLSDYLKSGNYNAEQEAQLKEKFNAFYDEVTADGSTSNVDELRKQLLEDFDTVPAMAVTSGEIKSDGTALDGSEAEYPDGFEGNLWGIVSKKDGTMEGGVDLVIAVKDGKTMEGINAARKDNKLVVANGSNLKAEDLKGMLGGKEVASTFDISLLSGDVKATTSGLYVVKVLLPESMRGLEGLQVVYENSDGTVEVYETNVEDGKYLVFTTAHFSEFVILTDGPTNLLWLVITLSVVLGLELVALLVILLKKGGKKSKKETAASVLPLGLLAGIVPAGALATCIVLGVAVVVVGVLIGLFAKMKKGKKPTDEETK